MKQSSPLKNSPTIFKNGTVQSPHKLSINLFSKWYSPVPSKTLPQSLKMVQSSAQC
uniref:Uncharacterized protein n=1 Tax=Anguilla anguilla TaxID=7936 RepID=A0A0E9UIK8_ANGAN